MKKDLDYYLGLPYPIESYFGEHEVGDAYLVQYIDFDINPDYAIEKVHS